MISIERIIRDRKIRVMISFFALSLVIFLQDQADAESNMISLYPAGSETNESHVVYEGEDSLLLRIEFPVNCTYWSVEFSSELFQHPFTDRVIENRSKGDALETRIEINPEASLGKYQIEIYFNYTDEDDQEIFSNRTYELDYVRIFEIKSISLPSRKNNELSLEIELFDDCQEVNVSFSSLEFGFQDEEIVRSDLKNGTHVFRTTIFWRDVRREQQSLGYLVKVRIDDRVLAYREYSIPIDWENDDSPSEDNQSQIYLGVVGVISLTIILISLIFFRSRNR